MVTAIDSIIRRRRLFVLVLVISVFLYLLDYKISRLTSRISVAHQDIIPLTDPLQQFRGYRECGIDLASLYEHPSTEKGGNGPYCPTRSALLRSMSEGGRHGFDSPFAGKGNRNTRGNPHSMFAN